MINNKKNRGFTVVEMLVAAVIMGFVMIGVYTLILSTQKTHNVESLKLDMNQAGRALETLLYDNIRNAGSVLALMQTPTLLSSQQIPFNGICPLNNVNFPDGIILASGDPVLVATLTANFSASGDTSLAVNNLDDPADPSKSIWNVNDTGMVIRPNGYYIFKVTRAPSAGSKTIIIRNTPVYYSGQLVTANYNDPCDDQNSGTKGNSITYETGCPVIKLTYFNMFLVKQIDSDTRALTLTVDTNGTVDVLKSAQTGTMGIPIVPNIQDIQFEYIVSPEGTLGLEFWASNIPRDGGTVHSNPCSSPGSADCIQFMDNLFSRKITSIKTYLLIKTAHQATSTQGMNYTKPAMGDAPSATLTDFGKFYYEYSEYETYIRNFNIVY